MMQTNRSFWLPLYRLSWGRARRRARRTSPWTCAGTEAADARGPSFSKLAGREELTDPFQVPSLTPPLLLSGLMGRNVRLKRRLSGRRRGAIYCGRIFASSRGSFLLASWWFPPSLLRKNSKRRVLAEYQNSWMQKRQRRSHPSKLSG